mgnify:CR=1 FL=1
MKKKNEHIVEKVLSGSIAEEMEITPGDALLEINGHKIEDIFDGYKKVEEKVNA